ncbi:MAG: ion transporter [Oscillospiraceae bacterium]|nr:ion transporter [Oscillospiraceae bacterium]
MKKSVKLVLSALAVYLVLLLLLLAAESTAPDASIRSFGDAIWYSLVTMTTVGYGDLSPVTPLGRILGTVFALCSVGILTALIGVGLHLISGAFLPRQRLRQGRRKKWYAFSAESPEAAALAAALQKEEPGCLLIFPEGEEKRVSGSGVVRTEFDLPLLLRLKGGDKGLAFFYMGAEPWDNYNRALASAKAGIDSYCMADLAAEQLPPELQLFSPTEVMSRSYWKAHPLTAGERTVVFIGGGTVGTALLERALLTNVLEKGRTIRYHVFGADSTFSTLHPEIMKALSGENEAEDSLCFHMEDWTEARTLLQQADRILICGDGEAENHSVYERLKSWYVSTAHVHVYLTEPVPGIDSFGGLADSFTPEFVMKDELNRRAVLMNDIYNEGAAQPTAWRDLSPFLRQSNIAAADHLIVKARYLLGDDGLTELSDDDCHRAYARFIELRQEQADLLQEMEHRRWLRFYQMYNWQYAPVRDNALRRHPLMVEYKDLSPEDRKKDAYAWEMLGRLGESRGI